METIKTSFGEITIKQTKEGIEITLAANEKHPGRVSVVVVNEGNGDTATLLWVR